MSKRRARLASLGICAAALTMSGPLQAAPTPSDISSNWASDWSAKNLDAVMQLYAPYAVFLPTVGASWNGTATIRKNCAGLQAKFNPHIVVHSIWTEASGLLAYDSGTYEETLVPIAGGKTIHARGNYIFVYRRGPTAAWKILEQTFTELEPVAL